jgi:hydrophobe/amphiphile efflux-1 (HAE1) family protein
MFSRFFINRPVFACVLSILIVVLGAVAYFTLPVAEYPELAPPVVHIEATYPGANAQTIADTVAQTLEQEINGVDHMIYMNSTSSDGRYALDVSFEQGTDVDMAAVLVNNRVSIATPRLPEEVRRQGVTVAKQSNGFVGVVSISPKEGHEKEYDDLFLSNYLLLNLRDEMSRIYGVGGLRVIPAKDYGMRIWLKPDELKARSLTVTDINRAIQAQNVQVAAGSIGKEPAPPGTEFELVLNTQGRLATAEEFGNIIVKQDPVTKGIVHLRDVGRIELGTKDYSNKAQFNARPAAIMICFQLPGANLVEVAANVNKKLDEFKENLAIQHPNLEAKMFYDASMFIKASLDSVYHTLAEAFLLVFVVVFVFLQSFRSTLIPMITIPVALIGAFLFMALFGFSVNTLTMFGLVLAIGIVVDDAIVVVENVERNLAHAKPGETTKQITDRSMSEIFGPIIAITLVLMSVFIPAASLSGITGQMYRQFALTIAASTGISALCALTLSPALCAIFLKPHHDHYDKKGSPITAPFRWFANGFNYVFGLVTSFYTLLVRGALAAWPVTLLAFGGVLMLTALVYRQVPGGFVPNEDLGFVAAAIQLPDSASLERSNAIVLDIAAEAKKLPGVTDVVALGGFSLIDGNGSNLGQIFVTLDPWAKRGPSKEHPEGLGIQTMIASVQAIADKRQGAKAIVFSLPAIRGLGNTSGIDLRIQDRTSQGRQALEQVTQSVVGAATGQQGKFAVVFTSFRPGVPQLFLDIDREKAIKLGVPLTSIFETLQTQLGSAYVNDFNLFGRTYQVNVQADAQFRVQPEDVLKFEVRNNEGGMVPLGTLVSIRDSYGPNQITRYNMYPSAAITGITLPGTSSAEAIGLMEKITADQSVFPAGGTFGAEWSSMSYQEKVASEKANPTLTFGLALLCVYLILAAQYESWTTPLAVVFSVPLVLIGAMAALWIRGLENNVFTQVGLVLLVGLGAKNAILIVEFARENRARGEGIIASAVDAAKVRFRPILMTSFAFILGVVPLVRSSGAGANSRQSLGTAVFGGMLGVTVLGLVFTPLLYVLVTATSEWIARKVYGNRPKRAVPEAQLATA